MNHAITIGDLVFTFCIFAGALCAGGSVLSLYGSPTGKTEPSGCVFFVLGVIAVVGGVWGLVS